MPTYVKIPLVLALTIGGIANIKLGERGPFSGQGFVTQFLPKEAIGILALASAAVILASFVSRPAGHVAEDVQQHAVGWQEIVSMVVGVPALLGIFGVFAFHLASDAVYSRRPLLALLSLLVVVVILLTIVINFAAVGINEPLSLLQRL